MCVMRKESRIPPKSSAEQLKGWGRNYWNVGGVGKINSVLDKLSDCQLTQVELLAFPILEKWRGSAPPDEKRIRNNRKQLQKLGPLSFPISIFIPSVAFIVKNSSHLCCLPQKYKQKVSCIAVERTALDLKSGSDIVAGWPQGSHTKSMN